MACERGYQGPVIGDPIGDFLVEREYQESVVMRPMTRDAGSHGRRNTLD